MILGGFGDHFGSPNGTRMTSEIDEKIVDFWIAPGGALGRHGRPAHVWSARGEDHGEG